MVVIYNHIVMQKYDTYPCILDAIMIPGKSTLMKQYHQQPLIYYIYWLFLVVIITNISIQYTTLFPCEIHVGMTW